MRYPKIFTLVVCASSALIAQTVSVDISHAVNTFVPTQALGAGIDRLPAGAIDKLLDPATMQQILSAGWQPVTYRQNTELFVEAWHWNPNGKWSDPVGRGYFTGSTALAAPIRHSYGYLLPHRGFTRNDGTGNTGYSRLTDGDLNTYWKSNPYLSSKFTGESDSLHPQWVIIDLATLQPVTSIRIAWAEPYARKYLVQYWTGEDPIHKPTRGVWQTFPTGEVTAGQGGTATLRLSAEPLMVQFLRILMTESSNTCDDHGSSDVRNCVGYAIREIFLGSESNGEFHDALRHTPDQDQTTTYCSSVDPWHEPADLDPKLRDQVGFDLFFTSGYTRRLPAIIPIALIYAVPEDAAAEIAYIQKRGYPVSYIEMGEEADGQYMLPEDYAALYLQFAAAIHRAVPSAKLGGPSFQGVNQDIETWPDAQGRTSWTARFIDYLKQHGRLQDLAFFSFEHYPLEPCKISWSSLYDEPTLVSHIMDVWRQDGVPANVPLIISESNIAWNTGESFPDIFGALWLTDYIGSFLTAGGSQVYFFHYMPLGLFRGCNDSWGTMGMFTVDKDLHIQQPVSQYFAARLINLEWAQPGNGEHKVFSANSDVLDSVGHSLVTAYALQRPDGQWSLMVVNRDQWNPHPVRIKFSNGTATTSFHGSVSVVTFGSRQYAWHPTEAGGFAKPDGPPATSTINATPDSLYNLPAASITVLRGNLAPQ